MNRHLKFSAIILPVLLFTTIVIADNGSGDSSEKWTNVLGMLSAIFGLSTAGVSALLMRVIRLVSKSKAALSRVTDLCVTLKTKVTDQELQKQADHATEAVADILDELGMISAAGKLRRLF